MLIHLMAQEAGAEPGAPLSLLKAVLYFGVIPVALFTVITAFAILADSPRGKNSQISSID
jgi:thiosulfate reductase cytochrome b subunit